MPLLLPQAAMSAQFWNSARFTPNSASRKSRCVVITCKLFHEFRRVNGFFLWLCYRSFICWLFLLSFLWGICTLLSPVSSSLLPVSLEMFKHNIHCRATCFRFTYTRPHISIHHMNLSDKPRLELFAILNAQLDNWIIRWEDLSTTSFIWRAVVKDIFHLCALPTLIRGQCPSIPATP